MNFYISFYEYVFYILIIVDKFYYYEIIYR
ncbi:MAG: hypothetical protein ACJAXF_001857 [Polaribacter sp.]|jgi:hypothetical protein